MPDSSDRRMRQDHGGGPARPDSAEPVTTADPADSAERPVAEGQPAAEPERAAQLFDLRTIIAVLFGVFGVVLLLVGLLGTDAGQRAKSGGLNLNLWTGAGMLVLCALFLAWVRLRPLQPVVPEDGADAGAAHDGTVHDGAAYGGGAVDGGAVDGGTVDGGTVDGGTRERGNAPAAAPDTGAGEPAAGTPGHMAGADGVDEPAGALRPRPTARRRTGRGSGVRSGSAATRGQRPPAG
jgi:hypothetical protein